MTNELTQFLSFMIAPVGALIFAGIMLYITRQDRRDAEKKHSSH
jgi:hypothetical protein